jgi:hypothetical protein
VSRALAAAPIALVVFIVVLAMSEAATRDALVSGDSVALWGGAIAVADGEVSVGGIVAAYPTIPFLAMAFLKFVTPIGTPAPALLSAIIAGLLAGTWFQTARSAGLSAVAAGVAVLLVSCHPALMRAAIEGPSGLLVAAFLYLLGVALYEFRARGGVAQAMGVGLALLGLSFSHPIGAVVAIGSVPFLAFATRPILIAGSALNIVFTLMFPAAFAAAAFCYISWVFPGEGWNFFTAPSEDLSAWAAGFAHAFAGISTGALAIDAAVATAAAIVLGAPVALFAIARAYRRRLLVAPALALAASVVVAATLAVATALCGSPATLAVAAPVLAVLALTRVSTVLQHNGISVLLLALGWLGGAASLAIVDPRIATQARATLAGQAPGSQLGDRELAEAIALGGAMMGREGVLVDTLNAPGVVVGRASARGLLSPWDKTFRLAVLFARVDAPFVAVPDPGSNTGLQDRLVKSFPLLYHNGLNNYRIVYQNNIWKLFEKVDRVAIYKD